MAATYEPIASTTISGNTTNTITFTSIPGTYTDLVLVGTGGYTFADTLIIMTFNNDSGTNYSATELTGDGSSPYSSKYTDNNYIWTGWYPYPRTAGQAQTDTGSVFVNINNYANTNVNKTVLIRNNTSYGNSGARQIVGLWRSTAAITSIKLTFNSYGTPYFTDGSQYTLYGIKAA